MFIEKAFQFLKKRVPWTHIAVILSLLIGASGLYATLHEKKSDVVYETINEVDVVNIRKPLEDLTIRFKQEDIQKKNLNLRILTILIKNIGEKDILQSHYDANDAWGMILEGGEIIDIRLVDSNSSYLKNNLNPKLFDSNTIHFTKVIFERMQFFILEILTLHSKNSTPSIIPIGKIAGIKNIKTFKSDIQKGEVNFLQKTFSGNLEIQAARAVTYFLIFLIFLIVLLLTYAIIDTAKLKWKENTRRKEISLLLQNTTLKDPYKKLISNAYINGEFDALIEIDSLLNNDKLLALYSQRHQLFKEQKMRLREVNSQINELGAVNKKDVRISATRISKRGSNKELLFINTLPQHYNDLFDKVLSKTTENKLVTVDELKIAVNKILKQLENKREESS